MLSKLHKERCCLEYNVKAQSAERSHMKKQHATLLGSLFVGITLTTVSVAQVMLPPPPPPPPPPPLEEPEPEEPKVNIKQKLVDRFVARYDVSEQQVIDMRVDGLGWGEIGVCLRIASKIAKRTDTPLDTVVNDLLAAREAGDGWGEIAAKYGAKPGRRASKPKLEEPKGHGRPKFEIPKYHGQKHGRKGKK